MNVNNKTNIFNLKNYKDICDLESDGEIVLLFVNVINNFIIYFVETVRFSNVEYYSYILNRGVEMIRHVFNLLFIYTKNTELIMHHLKKGYLYYIEFINQIGDDGKTFLKLNSKDAILFVYKKTIFDINTEYKKQLVYTDEEKERIRCLMDKVNIYILMTQHIINDVEFYDGLDNVKLINNKLKYLKRCIIKFMKNYDNNANIMNVYKKWLNLLNIKKINLNDKIELMMLFLQKYSKNNISLNDMENNMYEVDDKLLLESNNRFINRIFSK